MQSELPSRFCAESPAPIKMDCRYLKAPRAVPSDLFPYQSEYALLLMPPLVSATEFRGLCRDHLCLHLLPV